MPFPLLIALGAKLLGPLIGGVAKNLKGGGGQKDANDPARAQREANDIARRQNDITAENNRRVNDINAENNKRQNDRADKITDHEISQDKRQNRIDDQERARDNKFEDEDREVVRKQRERDEKVFQTSDDNDFIIRADFVKKAGALLKQITFGEFNIVIASGVSKDIWTAEPEGEIFSDVITVQLGGGMNVMYEVRIFETGTLVRNGSLERDAFFIWPKPTKKKPAIPAEGGKAQIPGPIGLMAGRMGAGLQGLVMPMLVTAALAGAQKKLEEEKAKPGADQNALTTALTQVRTFEFEELEKRHDDKQFERRLQKMADQMKGADADHVVEELDENEDVGITEPVAAKGKKKGKKSSRSAPQDESELQGDGGVEELDEEPLPTTGRNKGTKARRAGRQTEESAGDNGVEEATAAAGSTPRKAKKSLSSRVKNKTRQAEPEQDQGAEDDGEEDGQSEAAPAPQRRKKTTTKKAGRR